MGHFATGVTIVTCRGPGGEPRGLTANSFASVSLDPLLVLVCLSREAATLSCILEREAFGVCVLPETREALAVLFSEGDRGDRFDGLVHRSERTGSPILADALAWLDCELEETYPAGDHAIVLGRVVACDARSGEPLVFFRGRYRRVEP